MGLAGRCDHLNSSTGIEHDVTAHFPLSVNEGGLCREVISVGPGHTSRGPRAEATRALHGLPPGLRHLPLVNSLFNV